MQDLIVQSNLLSGGIENRFLHLFSQEAQEQLNELIKISQDKKLLQMLKEDPRATEQDQLLTAIVHKGTSEIVDKVIQHLQQLLERKTPLVAFARLSGEDGMRLSRAAFAVMIKFSELFDDFAALVDEVDMQWGDMQ